MNTLKNHPELMDRIINIQNLKAIIEPNYNRLQKQGGSIIFGAGSIIGNERGN